LLAAWIAWPRLQNALPRPAGGRFHLLPTKMEYAKALALNGRMAEAQRELQMIRAIYHPSLWALIEKDWLGWLDEHRAELPPAP